jgi:lipoyl(octanoyl) transferase
MGPALRIIVDTARPAAFNMAADRYLLGRAARESAVFLRIYSWDPPAISLGLLQDPAALLDKEAMARGGIEWTRRPTGGRAVLHWNDLTYSVAFPLSAAPMGGTIAESYSIISRCLRCGLESTGIRCETHDSSTEYSATKRNMQLPCFLSPNRNEIMAAGKKLVGSAQKRTSAAVLQHGSIPLDAAFRRLPEFLALSSDERTRQRTLLEKKCICVHEIDPSIDLDKLVSLLINGFKTTLPFPAFEKNWDAGELEAILGAL